MEEYNEQHAESSEAGPDGHGRSALDRAPTGTPPGHPAGLLREAQRLTQFYKELKDETRACNAVKYGLPQAWGEFLDKPEFHWAWYGHFTFRGDPHPESASKAWDKMIHRLNRQCFGQRYWKDPSKGVIWARGTEYQRRGAVHYHALIGNVAHDARRMDFVDEWYKMAGLARIFAYEPHQGAEYYMSKSTYAWKRGEIDLSETMKYHLDEMVLPSL